MARESGVSSGTASGGLMWRSRGLPAGLACRFRDRAGWKGSDPSGLLRVCTSMPRCVYSARTSMPRCVYSRRSWPCRCRNRVTSLLAIIHFRTPSTGVPMASRSAAERCDCFHAAGSAVHGVATGGDRSLFPFGLLARCAQTSPARGVYGTFWLCDELLPAPCACCPLHILRPISNTPTARAPQRECVLPVGAHT